MNGHAHRGQPVICRSCEDDEIGRIESLKVNTGKAVSRSNRRSLHPADAAVTHADPVAST